MTTILSHSSIRKWSVNSEHLQAVSSRLGVPSSWPEDPWAVGSLVGSSDGHSSGDPDGIWPVPCLLWLLPSRGNSMCRLVDSTSRSVSWESLCWSCFLYTQTRRHKMVVSRCWTLFTFHSGFSRGYILWEIEKLLLLKEAPIQIF